MHYLNPFFNTSRPVYIKLYAWKLPSEEANITPHSQSEWQSHGGENAWYDSTHGGWLQCMHYGYSAYGMKMTNIYMYHSYRIMASNCAHTHNKRWFGRNTKSNSITDSTYGTRTSAGYYWSGTENTTVNNHNSFSNSNNCWCTWRVTYKQTDPANAQGGTSWDDWGTENGANAGEYKYHIWNQKRMIIH